MLQKGIKENRKCQTFFKVYFKYVLTNFLSQIVLLFIVSKKTVYKAQNQNKSSVFKFKLKKVPDIVIVFCVQLIRHY